MTSAHQRGQVLLWLLLGLLLSASGLLWLADPARTQSTLPPPDNPTEQALDQAVTALLGYAAAYPENHFKGTPLRIALVPGHLPCPNLERTANPGQEATQCSEMGISSLGRLPWTTLGLPPLKDQSGECLWYGVSGQYKNNPKADLLNPDIPGQFAIDLLTPKGRTQLADDVVAVVISPGPPNPSQQRPFTADALCENSLVASQFLDAAPDGGSANFTVSTEAGAITRLTVALPVTELNDRIRWITRKMLWDAVNKRPDLRSERALFAASANLAQATEIALTQRVAACLGDFGRQARGRLPWAAPITLRTSRARPFETDAINDQKNLRAGRPPFLIWDSVQDIREAALAVPTTETETSSLSALLPGFAGCTRSDSADCRLFRTDVCTHLLPAAGHPTPSDGTTHRDSPDGWLDKWKDHLFYVLAPGFQPDRANPGCAGGCLRVNGRSYAALVIYSGTPQTGQQRLSLNQKQDIHQYLEEPNASNLLNGGLDFAPQGNDRIACLRPDLTLSPACTD